MSRVFSRKLNNPRIETGTWTPTLQDTDFSDGESQTYSGQAGHYMLIDNMCFFQGMCNITSLGTLTAGDQAYIAGLPFISQLTGVSTTSVHWGFASSLAITANAHISGTIASGGTVIQLRQWNATGGVTPLIISEMSAGANNAFDGFYPIAKF